MSLVSQGAFSLSSFLSVPGRRLRWSRAIPAGSSGPDPAWGCGEQLRGAGALCQEGPHGAGPDCTHTVGFTVGFTLELCQGGETEARSGGESPAEAEGFSWFNASLHHRVAVPQPSRARGRFSPRHSCEGAETPACPTTCPKRGTGNGAEPPGPCAHCCLPEPQV